MESNNIGYVLTGASLLILAFQAYIAFFRNKAQNVVDDSMAASNYRKMVIDMQGEIKELRNILEKSHLEVKLEITMGEAPVIKEWNWKPKVEAHSNPS